MDVESASEVLQASIDPNLRAEAKQKLSEVHEITGFGPTLLQVILSNEMELPTRQAGAVYLKNMVAQYWKAKEPAKSGEPVPFSLHEKDKAFIRDNILDAVVHAPDIIRAQLVVCVKDIARDDFPSGWPQILDKVSVYLQTPEPNFWLGALLCFRQLIQSSLWRFTLSPRPGEMSEFVEGTSWKRAPPALKDAMSLLLSQISGILEKLMPDESYLSVAVQKQILIVYYFITQTFFPLDFFSKEVFAQWIEFFRQITEADVPAHTLEVDDEERPRLIWWKRKKWALKILIRLFERLKRGSSRTEFSEWFKTFSGGILTAMLTNLNQYRTGVYVSPCVMQQALKYVNTAVKHASTWKLIKNHMVQIIKDIVFPLMSYSVSDAKLWDSDPYEFSRMKRDYFETEFKSPVSAAQQLLHLTCKKRKQFLENTMALLMEILQATGTTPSQRDGALHMIGTLGDILLKRSIYIDQMETFLVEIVFKEFGSLDGYLRARVCWILGKFSDIKYNEPVLAESFRLIVNSLLNDKELPVKIEAALALRAMLSSKGETAKKYLTPQFKEITLKLLNIIRKTKDDDVSKVMEKFVSFYKYQLVPMAVDICLHLVGTVTQVIESYNTDAFDLNNNYVTAMNILHIIDTIVFIVRERIELLAALEPVLLQAIYPIFMNSIDDFYAEATSLTCKLTAKHISSDMWKMLEVIYTVVTKDDFYCYFEYFMPTLLNYITVDTKAFLSNPDYMMAMCNISRTIFEEAEARRPPGRYRMTFDEEDPECLAAKLLEVILLHCKNYNIDQVISIFVELVLNRYLITTPDLRIHDLPTKLLQVMIAALCYNPELLFSILEETPMPGGTASVTAYFIQQWVNDANCFSGLHGTKICAIGLCHLLQMPNQPAVVAQSQLILPALVELFDTLKYYEIEEDVVENEVKVQVGVADDNDTEYGLLESDEDVVDKPRRWGRGSSFGGDEKINIEVSTDPLEEMDEYTIFSSLLLDFQTSNPTWYQQLTGHLFAYHWTVLNEINNIANQRIAAKESKKFGMTGGNSSGQQAIPGVSSL